MRINDFLLAAALFAAACGRSPGSHEPFAAVECAVTQLSEVIQPSPAVTFIGDTSSTLQVWRAAAGEPIEDLVPPSVAAEIARLGLYRAR